MRPRPRRVKAVAPFFVFFPPPKCLHTRQTPEGALKPAPMVAARERSWFNPSLIILTHVFVCNQKQALSSATKICYYLLKKASCEGLDSCLSPEASVLAVAVLSPLSPIACIEWRRLSRPSVSSFSFPFFFQLYIFTFMRPVTHWPPLTSPLWQINYIEACTAAAS